MKKNLRIARYYPVARTAHLERLASMTEGSLLFEATRMDWDETLAQSLPAVRRVNFSAVVSAVWRGDFDRLEVPEPLAIALLPRLLILSITRKIARRRRGGRSVLKFVFYAIENHDQVAKIRSRLKLPRFLVRTLLRWSVAIVCSETSRVAFGTSGANDLYRDTLGERRWEKLNKRSKVEVIEGLSAAAPSGDESDRNFVTFVGSLEPRKGILALLAAWPHVERMSPTAELMIIGHGPLSGQVSEFASKFDHVQFAEDPSRDFIRTTLDATKCLVLPSQRTPVWREQIGLPILEGLSHGCEIVTTSETGIADWLLAHGHRVLAPESEALELAEAIRAAITSVRSARDIKGDLPALDGRVTADSWLFEVSSFR